MQIIVSKLKEIEFMKGVCTRCLGRGFFRSGMESGRCYQCNGSGAGNFIAQSVTRTKGRTLEERVREFRQQHPIVAWWLDNSKSTFAASLRLSLEGYGSLTPRQIKAAYSAQAREGQPA